MRKPGRSEETGGILGEAKMDHENPGRNLRHTITNKEDEK